MNTKTNRSLIVSLVLLIAVLAALSVLPPAAKQANAATYQHHHQAVTITAVEASPLNGVTPGRTYQSSDLDKTASNVVELGPRCDIVDIYAYGTGSAAQTATLKIWAYSANGPARLVWSGTAALGTAVADTGKLYADAFTETVSDHYKEVKASNGTDRVGGLAFDTLGYKYLRFEVTAMTMTDIAFNVRQAGYVSRGA